jgi:hypothetical protein
LVEAKGSRKRVLHNSTDREMKREKKGIKRLITYYIEDKRGKWDGTREAKEGNRKKARLGKGQKN